MCNVGNKKKSIDIKRWGRCCSRRGGAEEAPVESRDLNLPAGLIFTYNHELWVLIKRAALQMQAAGFCFISTG